MENFNFLITSSTEREELACEIYYKDELIAEITQETEDPLIEIFPSKLNKWWSIPLEDFQQAVSYAKSHLFNE